VGVRLFDGASGSSHPCAEHRRRPLASDAVAAALAGRIGECPSSDSVHDIDNPARTESAIDRHHGFRPRIAHRASISAGRGPRGGSVCRSKVVAQQPYFSAGMRAGSAAAATVATAAHRPNAPTPDQFSSRPKGPDHERHSPPIPAPVNPGPWRAWSSRLKSRLHGFQEQAQDGTDLHKSQRCRNYRQAIDRQIHDFSTGQIGPDFTDPLCRVRRGAGETTKAEPVGDESLHSVPEEIFHAVLGTLFVDVREHRGRVEIMPILASADDPSDHPALGRALGEDHVETLMLADRHAKKSYDPPLGPPGRVLDPEPIHPSREANVVGESEVHLNATGVLLADPAPQDEAGQARSPGNHLKRALGFEDDHSRTLVR
jgi:hypothetical protein